MDDMDKALDKLMWSGDERETKQAAQLLFHRALTAWNEVTEESNKVANKTEGKQRAKVKAFFRWRLIPSWMRTKGGLLLLVSLAACGADRSTEPVTRALEYFLAVALGCVIAMQLMRMFTNSMHSTFGSIAESMGRIGGSSGE